jgi:long-chain acyl-CoA synthetase
VVAEDDPTRVLAMGQTGLLAVAGPQVMAGYWRDAEATAAVLRGGWLLTGDLAVQDATGSFLVVDRVVDVATTPAGDAFPGDVEAVLADHPAVRTAVASTRPTTHGGDEVVVTVELSAPVTVQELTAWCRERLPAHAVPARLDVVESLAPPPSGTLRPRGRPGGTGKEVAG